MQRRGWHWLAGWVVAAALGCGGATTHNRTGAEEAAHGYYEALLHQDWPRAYAVLHPDSRKRFTGEQFARLAQAQRKRLGFEPQEVKVRSCEEHGSSAVAHVVLLGPASAKRHTFQDAVALRQGPAGWAVVLPPRFGEAP
jgi:hypothetical protein